MKKVFCKQSIVQLTRRRCSNCTRFISFFPSYVNEEENNNHTNGEYLSLFKMISIDNLKRGKIIGHHEPFEHIFTAAKKYFRSLF